MGKNTVDTEQWFGKVRKTIRCSKDRKLLESS